MVPFIFKFSNRWRWEVNQPPLQRCTLYSLIWRIGGLKTSGSGRFGDGKILLPCGKIYPGSSNQQQFRSYKTSTETSKHRNCMTTATMNFLPSLKISWQQKEVETLWATSLFGYENKSITSLSFVFALKGSLGYYKCEECLSHRNHYHHHYEIFLTTGPQPLPARILQTVRPSVFSFSFQYLVSLRSANSRSRTII
jgi:hypothetical protein